MAVCNYFRIETHTVTFPDPEVILCNRGYLSLSGVVLVREDTAAKKLYYPNGYVAIDFNLQPGDTLLKVTQSAQIFSSVVDSVGIQRIQGVDRRMQWATAAGNNGFRYTTIEGIGMNYNFPAGGFGNGAFLSIA